MGFGEKKGRNGWRVKELGDREIRVGGLGNKGLGDWRIGGFGRNSPVKRSSGIPGSKELSFAQIPQFPISLTPNSLFLDSKHHTL